MWKALSMSHPGLPALHRAGPVLVDVKPRDQVNDPKIAETFAWVHDVVDSLGWSIRNRQRAAWSTPWRMSASLQGFGGGSQSMSLRCAQLRTTTVGLTLGEAYPTTHGAEPLVRAALLHMLWTHELSTDLSKVLSSTSILTSPGSSHEQGGCAHRRRNAGDVRRRVHVVTEWLPTVEGTDVVLRGPNSVCRMSVVELVSGSTRAAADRF